MLVLDTNVVFDWLLFDDPSCRVLSDAITTGRVVWVASREMMDEADHVLARGDMRAMAHRHDDLRAARSRWAREVLPAKTPGARLALRCTDPDDQKFIDLAVDVGASWLLTRDKALLRLRSRAAGAGVIVQRPAQWLPPRAISSPDADPSAIFLGQSGEQPPQEGNHP